MTFNRRKALLGALALVAVPAGAIGLAAPEASEWRIGPIIKGRNYSVNMPPTLEQGRDGPGFDFPYPDAAAGHVHYVTAPIGSLRNTKRITLRYRIDAARGVRFVPQEVPAERATLSLYFQQNGDRWTARYPTHRWYSPANRMMPLAPGTYRVSIALDEPWVAMMGGTAADLPAAFAAARTDAVNVGFVFGSASGRGHGVYATGPARFTVLDFRID